MYKSNGKLIGKGAFSKAYLLPNNQVEIVTSDKVKECMALWGLGESRLWPEIERIHYGYDFGVYIMPLYDKPKSLKNSLNEFDYSLYQALRKLPLPMYHQIRNEYVTYFNYWHATFDTLPEKFNNEKQALKEALDSLSNYADDMQFEISPRNVAVKDGQLILLDCFFIVSELHKIKSKRAA